MASARDRLDGASAPPPPTKPEPEPGVMLAGTRTAIVLLFVLAAANGLFLYLWPGQALTDYAWPIFPPLNAAFLGAGYLSGAVAAVFALVTVRRWRSIEAMLWPLAAFAALTLAATALQASDFDWHHEPLTWLWTGGYAVVLIGAGAIWRWQRTPLAGGTGPGRAVGPLSALSAAVGLALVLLGVFVFVAPGTASTQWPWAITSLLARVFGGWYVLQGGLLVVAGVGAPSWAAAFIPYLTVAAWTFLVVILPVSYGESFRTTSPTYGFWLGLQLVVLLVGAAGVRRSLGMMRAAPTP